MFFFQHGLADIVVPANDLAFIDMIWRDWSPGYDATADLVHVKGRCATPSTSPQRSATTARRWATGTAIPPSTRSRPPPRRSPPSNRRSTSTAPTTAASGAEVAESARPMVGDHVTIEVVDGLRSLPPPRTPRRGQRPHRGVPGVTARPPTGAARRSRGRQARLRDLSHRRAGAAPARDADGDGGALTVYTQDDPPSRAIRSPCTITTWRSAGTTTIETVPTLIRVADGREVARTVGWSRDQWNELTGRADLGPTSPDAARLRFDERRPRSRRRAPRALRRVGAALASHRGRRARGRDGADVPARLDRRAPRRSTHRGAGAADARRHRAVTRRDRRHGAARPGRRDRREGRDRRGDGRLPPRVPPVGAHRGGGRVQRRVQHARRARHHHAGRAR
jgi:hypothetical protein